MAERNGAAVEVALVQVHSQFVQRLDGNGAKGLIDLDEVQIRGAPTGAVKGGEDGVGRLGMQGVVRARHLARNADDGEDVQSVLLGVGAGRENQCSGAVGQRGRVPRCDGAFRIKGRTQAGQRLGSGVGPNALVGGEHEWLAPALGNGDGDNLRVEDTGGHGCGCPAVRRGSNFVLLQALDRQLRVAALRGDAHGIVVEGIGEAVVGHRIQR
jgi:hypothetical protein